MIGIQEMVDKCEPQLRSLKRQMDTGIFHPELASILTDQKPSVLAELKESLRNIPLSEFLGKAATGGVTGAQYLVPDKIHDQLVCEAGAYDIAPLISRVVSGWQGGDLKVNIVDDETYKAQFFASGAQLPTETGYAKQATITPVSVGINIGVAGDLFEDAAYDMIQFHVANAARAVAEVTNDLAITVLKAATDGWGTVNSSATGDADETRLTGGTTSDIVTATRGINADRWIPDTILTTPEAWCHSISVQAAPSGWTLNPPQAGYNTRVGILDVLLNTNKTLHLSTDAVGAAFTKCVTIIFNRTVAMLTGRKRWMQLENYANPVQDLPHAVVTCRQDSVTLYNDSIYVLTET